MREWPYTASNRDDLGCTSPPTSRFPSGLGKSLGRRGCTTQYIPPLGSVHIQYQFKQWIWPWPKPRLCAKLVSRSSKPNPTCSGDTPYSRCFRFPLLTQTVRLMKRRKSRHPGPGCVEKCANFGNHNREGRGSAGIFKHLKLSLTLEMQKHEIVSNGSYEGSKSDPWVQKC